MYEGAHSQDLDSYAAFETKHLLEAGALTAAHLSAFFRCRIPADAAADTVADCYDVAARAGAPEEPRYFPWYNKQFLGNPHRYAYTTAAFPILVNGTRHYASGSVAKWNVEASTLAATWTAPTDVVLTEAIFVPQFPDRPPTPANEDAGMLLTVAFDTKARRSVLYGVDPRTMASAFAVPLGAAMPLHYHGVFCNGKRADGRPFCVSN